MKTLKVRTIGLSFSAALLLSSCASTYEAIGNVNMLSVGRIDTTLNYRQLTVNSGGGKKELKASKAENINQAITQIVNAVPGGRYLTNVTVYVVDDGYYAVTGDVWGVIPDTLPAGNNISYQKIPATPSGNAGNINTASTSRGSSK